MVTFKEAQITCTAWLPIFISFATGWLAGILGIGGGLIRMPALIYFIGCPTHVAVGTDLFEVMISGLYGTGTYAYKGRVELVAAVIMLWAPRWEPRSAPWPPSTSRATASASSSVWPSSAAPSPSS